MNVSISMTNSIVSEEDMSVELCVKVAGLLDKIVNITVDSNNGSAVGKCILSFFSVYKSCIVVIPGIFILIFVSNTITNRGNGL